MTDDERLENAKPIAQLIEALKLAGIATRDIIQRDLNAGQYDLEALRLIIESSGVLQAKRDLRKELSEDLSKQGFSNRQIAKVLGVSPMTVGRDVGVTNVTQSVPNVTPKSKPDDGRLSPEQVTELLKKEIEKLNKEHQKDVEKLNKRIGELQPDPTEFEKQINTLIRPLVLFIQQDELVGKLSDLEAMKEDVLDEANMHHLDRVIQGLISLSQRAQWWSQRLTPTNSGWKHRVYRPYERELKP